MGFPIISSITNSFRASNNVADTVTFPAAAAGDLLIVVHCAENHGGSTIPSPWVEIQDLAGAGPTRLFIAYTIAVGGESSVVVTKDTTERFAAQTIRYLAANWHGTTPPEVSAGQNGSSANPNPGSLTASWGSADNQFLTVFSMDSPDTTAPVTVYPLPDNQIASDIIFSAAWNAVCSQNVVGATLNPSAYTVTATETWAACTMVVRGTGAVGGGNTSSYYNWRRRVA